MATSKRKKAPVHKGKQAKPHTKVAPGSAKGADGLTEQQHQFIRAYRLSRNATQAAIAAGYSPATATTQGSRLLRHVHVSTAIEQADTDERVAQEAQMVEIKATLGITIERTLLELARIATFDVRRLFHADGRPKEIHEIDDDTAAAISGVDVLEQRDSEGNLTGYIKKWRSTNKNPAVDMLMKHQNLYAAHDKGKVQPFAEALAGFLGQLHQAGGSPLPIRQPAKKGP